MLLEGLGRQYIVQPLLQPERRQHERQHDDRIGRGEQGMHAGRVQGGDRRLERGRFRQHDDRAREFRQHVLPQAEGQREPVSDSARERRNAVSVRGTRRYDRAGVLLRCEHLRQHETGDSDQSDGRRVNFLHRILERHEPCQTALEQFEHRDDLRDADSNADA